MAKGGRPRKIKSVRQFEERAEQSGSFGSGSELSKYRVTEIKWVQGKIS